MFVIKEIASLKNKVSKVANKVSNEKVRKCHADEAAVALCGHKGTFLESVTCKFKLVTCGICPHDNSPDAHCTHFVYTHV